MSPNMIGKSVRRVEDAKFLTGQGRYVGDLSWPGMCHGVVMTSPHAHARIRSIDVEAAKSAPGVICVLTGNDVLRDGLGGMPPLFMPEDMGGAKGYTTYRTPLVTDKVRCVGDRVAFVVAETLEQAQNAVELVEVDFDPLPAAVSPESAVAPGAPSVHDDNPGNHCCMVVYGNEESVNAAFSQASHVTKVQLRANRLTAVSIEPRCALGVFNVGESRFELYTSSQNPHGVREMLATHVFRQPESDFRVVSPDVGGGFGMKGDAYPEDALVLWAARKCGRPVKWVASRSESFLGDNHGRDQVVTGEMALDKDGHILGIKVRSMHGFGAYVVSAAVAPLTFSMRLVPSVYDVKAFHAVNVGVFTNTSPVSVYRGAGRPEAAYLIERLMDTASRELGIDPVELRRRNLIKAKDLPYATQTGFVYDSGNFEQLLDRCQKLADWDGYDRRIAESVRKGLKRGRAAVLFIEQAGIFNDKMGLRFDPSGAVTILAGTHSHGQSHATVFSQLVSEWLSVPLEMVRYVQGDTDKVHYGRGTYAARSSLIGGSALHLATQAIIEKARPVAAHLLGVDPKEVTFESGQFRAGGGATSVSMIDTAKASYRKMGLPPGTPIGLEAFGDWAAAPPNFPNGCHICEVEVDPATGAVRVDRYSAVDDVGRALNPMICEGQLMGGIAQGIGQALMEHVVYEPESGQLLSGSLMDYAVPRAADMPQFRLELAEFPCATNPLGVKGVGESGAIGAPACVMNAVHDALREFGVGELDMPATPARVWAAIRAARPDLATRIA